MILAWASPFKEMHLIEFWDYLNCLQCLHMSFFSRSEVEISIAVS